MNPFAFGVLLFAATLATGGALVALGYGLARSLFALWDAAAEALRRRRLRRAVAAIGDQAGDALAVAVILIGGLIAIGQGLALDAAHARAAGAEVAAAQTAHIRSVAHVAP